MSHTIKLEKLRKTPQTPSLEKVFSPDKIQKLPEIKSVLSQADIPGPSAATDNVAAVVPETATKTQTLPVQSVLSPTVTSGPTAVADNVAAAGPETAAVKQMLPVQSVHTSDVAATAAPPTAKPESVQPLGDSPLTIKSITLLNQSPLSTIEAQANCQTLGITSPTSTSSSMRGLKLRSLLTLLQAEKKLNTEKLQCGPKPSLIPRPIPQPAYEFADTSDATFTAKSEKKRIRPPKTNPTTKKNDYEINPNAVPATRTKTSTAQRKRTAADARIKSHTTQTDPTRKGTPTKRSHPGPTGLTPEDKQKPTKTTRRTILATRTLAPPKPLTAPTPHATPKHKLHTIPTPQPTPKRKRTLTPPAAKTH